MGRRIVAETSQFDRHVHRPLFAELVIHGVNTSLPSPFAPWGQTDLADSTPTEASAVANRPLT
jgi:hypothetical protein